MRLDKAKGKDWKLLEQMLGIDGRKKLFVPRTKFSVLSTGTCAGMQTAIRSASGVSYATVETERLGVAVVTVWIKPWCLVGFGLLHLLARRRIRRWLDKNQPLSVSVRLKVRA